MSSPAKVKKLEPFCRISSVLLMDDVTELFKQRIFDTLDMYKRGEDLTHSPVAEWGRETLAQGKWWYGCGKAQDQEKAIKERLLKVVKLYESIKKYGYTGANLSVFFTKTDGKVHLYDGFHRVVIMEYLGMHANVNVLISTRDPNPARRGDFPLARTLIKLNNGKFLYQPCQDPRVKDFKVWRKDSLQRLVYILSKLQGTTVLDVGCCEGYFARALARRGYEVTAIDSNRSRVAVTRYLSIINTLTVNCEVNTWQKYLERDVHFDNVLFLSVFHHTLLAVGGEKAFNDLLKLKGKADRVFLEAPIDAGKIAWICPAKKQSYSFTESEFRSKLETQTGMRVVDVWRLKRPTFLLEA